MRIYILEDEASESKLLAAQLNRYAKEEQMEICLGIYTTSRALLDAFAAEPADIAFLDIYLEGLGRSGTPVGVEVAWQLHREFPRCKLVFATSSTAHAVESYSIRAAFYLTKPLDYQKLCAAMEVAAGALRQESRCIGLVCNGILVEVPLREIMYMDSRMEQATLHLPTQTIQVDGLVSDTVATLLTHEQFLLCNRNLAVNMDWVSEATKDCFLLKNGTKLSIRQHGRRDVIHRYMAYRLERIQRSQSL